MRHTSARFGRPPVGVDHVDRLDGPAVLKRRLKVLLATLAGELSVEDACEELGVRPSRLHTMRWQALAGALEGLTPGRAGRPAKTAPRSAAERALEAQIQALERELQAERVRTELALALPRQVGRGLKKKALRRKAKRKPKPML